MQKCATGSRDCRFCKKAKDIACVHGAVSNPYKYIRQLFDFRPGLGSICFFLYEESPCAAYKIRLGQQTGCRIQTLREMPDVTVQDETANTLDRGL